MHYVLDRMALALAVEADVSELSRARRVDELCPRTYPAVCTKDFNSSGGEVRRGWRVIQCIRQVQQCIAYELRPDRSSFSSEPRIAVLPMAFCSFTAISGVVPLRSNQVMKPPSNSKAF